MTRTACPNANRVGCPVAERKGGCFADTDHIVPQRYKRMSLLVRKYIVTPENKQQICRWEHEEKTTHESPALIPDEAFMLDAVRRAVDDGLIPLNKRDTKRLFGDSHEETNGSTVCDGRSDAITTGTAA